MFLLFLEDSATTNGREVYTVKNCESEIRGKSYQVFRWSPQRFYVSNFDMKWKLYPEFTSKYMEWR
jgi:hypothetical protein